MEEGQGFAEELALNSRRSVELMSVYRVTGPDIVALAVCFFAAHITVTHCGHRIELGQVRAAMCALSGTLA